MMRKLCIRFVILLSLVSSVAGGQVCTDAVTLLCPSEDPSCDACPVGSSCSVSTSRLSNIGWNNVATDVALMCLEIDSHSADASAHHTATVDTDTTCLDAGVTCLFAASDSEGGAATTATALAADPAGCSANQFGTDTDTAGALTCAQPAFTDLSGSATDAQVPDTITVDLATAATALAADPAACSANQFGIDTNASGALSCAQPAFSDLSGAATDGQIPDTITVTLAATATALAANGANCSAGSAPLGTDASGAVESCTDYEEDLADSAGLAAAISDETGTGLAVFGTAPTLATPVTTGKVDRNNVAVDDDDCTGEQGLWWYDTTDSAFEWCDANSGAPSVLGAGGGVQGVTGDGAQVLIDADEDGTPEVEVNGSASNRLLIEADGGVIIGGASTSADLEIRDSATASLLLTSGANSDSAFTFAQGSGSSAWTIKNDGLGKTNADEFQILNAIAAPDDISLSIDSTTSLVALPQNIGADPGATCEPGTFFIDTDETDDTNCTTTADNSLCLCVAANTWVAFENN